MKPGEEWRWDGRCVCCGCEVVFRVQWQWMGQKELSMQHRGEEATEWARLWVDDEVMLNQADLKAAVAAVSERLYGDGLC